MRERRSEINSEIAAAMASQLAVEEQQLIATVSIADADFSRMPSDPSFYVGRSDTSCTITLYTDKVLTFSDRTRIALTRDTDGLLYVDSLGIETDFVLEVEGYHEQEHNQYLNAHPGVINSSHYSTYYYFNPDGKYKKAQKLPRSLVKFDRAALDVDPNCILVESDFTPEDFELAAGALALLREKIQYRISIAD